MAWNFKVDTRKWINYLDVIGDLNEIHRDPSVASLLGFKDIIAPGMFIASHIQGGERIGSIEEVRFKKEVYNGEELEVHLEEKGPKDSGVFDYEVRQDGNLICEIKGVSKSSGKIDCSSLENPVFETSISSSSTAVGRFLNSLEACFDRESPEFYLMSSSCKALTEFGLKYGVNGGSHTRQSINIYRDFEPDGDDIAITMGDIKGRKRNTLDFMNCPIIWSQDGNVLARGHSYFTVPSGSQIPAEYVTPGKK